MSKPKKVVFYIYDYKTNRVQIIADSEAEASEMCDGFMGTSDGESPTGWFYEEVVVPKEEL